MTDRQDLFEHDKLIRPNGICLAGTWTATPGTHSWTGYFAPGRKGRLIVRASVLFDNVERGSYRAFGLAGKLFPTEKADERVQTANFFTIDDNAGTKLEHFLDATLLNEPVFAGIDREDGFLEKLENAIVSFSSAEHREFLKKHLGAIMNVNKAQKAASAESGEPKKVTGIRQLYPIAEAGLTEGAVGLAPKYLKIIGSPAVGRPMAADFRNQLRVGRYEKGAIVFYVLASDSKHDDDWTTVARLELTEDAVSEGCDRWLHFAHPIWK